eukprot:364397-Chlamydomonas_euryale.AAC.12
MPSLNRLLRTRRASRNFASSLPATCSAAPPRGQRMIGTTLSVTQTENRPSTMPLMELCASDFTVLHQRFGTWACGSKMHTTTGSNASTYAHEATCMPK